MTFRSFRATSVCSSLRVAGVPRAKKSKAETALLLVTHSLSPKPSRLARRDDNQELLARSGCALARPARLELLPPKTWTLSNLNARLRDRDWPRTLPALCAAPYSSRAKLSPRL